MKTIFRFTTLTVLLAAIFAIGATATFAQDVCSEGDAIAALDAKFRENYGKGIAERKIAVEAGKQYIEKYGSCATQKDFVDYLKSYLPGMEKKIKDDESKAKLQGLYTRFDASVGAKPPAYDETYTVGKEILAIVPDQLDVMIVLGSIGYDESFKKNFKYNADTLKYARQAITALEAGKTSKNFGIFGWAYNNKENALGWLNYTIGYIYQYGEKNKKEALPYLYKAAQYNSDTKGNPLVYESMASYYVDELNKQIQELQALVKAQSDTDTDEVKKEKVEGIKAKVAIVNGTAERALEVYSRAYKLATDPKSTAYKASLYKSLQDIYKIRFEKGDSLNAWIDSAVGKPLTNPTTPIAPVSDTDPTASTMPAAPVPATTAKPSVAPSVKPAVPAAKPSTVAKPAGSAVKKPVAIKKVTK